MTNWINAGNYSGIDDQNQSSMLYYENCLDSWLANYPNHYFDYEMTQIYQKNEFIPRQIELQYVGINYLEVATKNTVQKPLENGSLL